LRLGAGAGGGVQADPPAERRVGDDRQQVFDPLSHHLAEFDQEPLLGLGEVGSLSQLGPQDLVLRPEVFHLLGQFAVRAAGEEQDKGW
jgi:hypothetical protein